MRSSIAKTLSAFLCSAAFLSGCSGGADTPVPPPTGDTTPTAFSFADQTGVAPSAAMTSAPLTITGIDSPSPVTVSGTGGTYSVGCTATYTAASGTINNNQTVCVRHTSAATGSTATNTLLTVGGVSDTFTSTTAATTSDTTPDAFNFTDQAGVAASTVITSAPVTIAGINAPASVSVAGGSYSVGCTAAYITTVSTINNNQTVCVRHTSAAAASTVTGTTLTVGGVSDTFTSTTAGTGPDTTPNAFNFVDQTGVAASTVITSAPVTITGINAASAVSVAGAGGSYSVGCTATFTTANGTISNGQTVCVRHTSAAAPSTATSTTLTVGGVADTFTSTTAGVVADTTPDAFSFTDQAGVTASTVITSAPVTITGINAPAAVSVAGAGGSYSVGCTATFTTANGTISNGQTVCVRHTSAAGAGAATSTTLTVGGVSDTFTSTTTAGAVVGLLPFLTGTGEVRLFDPTSALSTSNPKTVDTGLAAPPTGATCFDCFDKAQTFYKGTISGTAISNVHASRLAYAKRAIGNNSGGSVFKVDLGRDAPSNLPVRISSLTDACTVIRTETADFANIDNSAVAIDRAGADLSCDATADNVVAVIRLNSPVTGTGSAGTSIRLVRDAGMALVARTSSTGAVTGFVSFELSGVTPLLVRRDVNLANPVTLLTMEQTTGANMARADLTHLFVTASPALDGLKLFRVETSGSLSPVLHNFAGFNAGNPIQDGVRDATNLYFSDANQMLRIGVDSTTANAAVITTMADTLRIGNRALDSSTTPGRIVFEAQNDSISIAGGVFSAATTANNLPATTLANNPPPDAEGGYAVINTVTNGRVYINIANHNMPADSTHALKINTDGTGLVTITSSYWAGSNRASAFDMATTFVVPTQMIFIAHRVVTDGVGTDTVKVVSPSTGVIGSTLGTVTGASVFIAVNINGLGRFGLARIEIDRAGTLDFDVYRLDSNTGASLAPLVESAGSNDIPLDGQQHLNGNLCLLCL